MNKQTGGYISFEPYRSINEGGQHQMGWTMKKQTGKRKVAHGSPQPTASPTPRTHDRWAVPVAGNSTMYACGCGAMLGGYWEWVEHMNGCRKVGVA